MKVYRYAPSPSGLLHLGHLPGSLLNYVLARSENGKFLLRIEDTDLKRNKDDAVDNIIKDFKWLGLNYDQGPESGSKKNDFFQSERLELYKKYVDQLLAEGKAYKAYETPEEREAQILEQRKSGKLPIYMGGHANLTDEQKTEFEAAGRVPVVRLKVQPGRWIKFKDMIYGEVSVNTDAVGDFVIQRSNGFPMYNMAVVVDDHLMGVTDVIRGFDHLNNTPKQILIYEALGWETPNFGHHSSLLAETEKGKLSKRKGAKPIAQYRAEGYLPISIFNYMIVTFCSFSFKSKDEEIMTKEEIFSRMSVNKILKTNPKFNSQKLDWFNGQHIRKLSKEELYDTTISWLENYAKDLKVFNPEFDDSLVDLFLSNKDLLKSALPIIHERINKLSDIFEQLKFLFTDPILSEIDITQAKQPDEIFDKEAKKLYNTVNSLTEPWTHSSWEESIRKQADEAGLKHGDMFMVLRLLIVGSRFSPPLYESMEILGKEKCLARIQNYLNYKKI